MHLILSAVLLCVQRITISCIKPRLHAILGKSDWELVITMIISVTTMLFENQLFQKYFSVVTG
jgi:type IV secretory pathway VirB2 component (pilin)